MDDVLPAPLVFAATAALLALGVEVGFRLGRRSRGANGPRERPSDGRVSDGRVSERKSHAGVLLGALLALLGLMLAFSFSIVESRFQARKQLVLREANAIGTAYLRAGLLPSPHREQVRALLRAYVGPRATLESAEQLPAALEAAEARHVELWRVTEAVAKEDPRSEMTALFVVALNDVIDLHQERVTVALYGRLPHAILWSLLVIAWVASALLGYGAGLAGSRGVVPSSTVIAAVALVIVLIVELDRPWQRMFTVGRQALADVQAIMTLDP